MQLKAWAPARLRKQPETFCWTLIIRRSRSARLLSKSTRRSSEARREPLSGVCASDRANCVQGFVCICPWLLAGQWPVESLDRLDAASGRIALPSPPLPPGATSALLRNVLARSPPSDPEADS